MNQSGKCFILSALGAFLKGKHITTIVRWGWIVLNKCPRMAENQPIKEANQTKESIFIPITFLFYNSVDIMQFHRQIISIGLLHMHDR